MVRWLAGGPSARRTARAARPARPTRSSTTTHVRGRARRPGRSSDTEHDRTGPGLAPGPIVHEHRWLGGRPAPADRPKPGSEQTIRQTCRKPDPQLIRQRRAPGSPAKKLAGGSGTVGTNTIEQQQGGLLSKVAACFSAPIPWMIKVARPPARPSCASWEYVAGCRHISPGVQLHIGFSSRTSAPTRVRLRSTAAGVAYPACAAMGREQEVDATSWSPRSSSASSLGHRCPATSRCWTQASYGSSRCTLTCSSLPGDEEPRRAGLKGSVTVPGPQ